MKILVINTGSSSLKYQLFEMGAAKPYPLASGLAERIGDSLGILTHKKDPGEATEKKLVKETPLPDHATALRLAMDLMTGSEAGVIKDASEIAAVGHRVVHGGEHFHDSTLITDSVIEAIKHCVPLAPLHNPPNLTGILTAKAIFESTPQVAVFDTAFHQSMAPEVYLYALPYECYADKGVRRYGFHGTSHWYVAKEAAAFLGKPLAEVNLITLHLGNGSSITAVKNGKSMDTSMGLTPLAGVIMGTRCGDIDPAIIFYLARESGLSTDQLDDMLNKKSGFKGICGSNDLRDIHKRADEGDARSKLALDMFAYRNKKYIGSYMAALGRVDAIVFTAGIGENDTQARAATCAGLENMGVVMDPALNASPERGIRRISAEKSPVAVLVAPTNEELEIANQTLAVLKKKG